jgi:hypothetical protein
VYLFPKDGGTPVVLQDDQAATGTGARLGKVAYLLRDQ